MYALCQGLSIDVFIEPELGRARFYQQWGDGQETIKIAIDTCPVNCIHYVPYEELTNLDRTERSEINAKARLVSRGGYGGGQGHMVGEPSVYTGPQKISGNMGSMCNSCPS